MISLIWAMDENRLIGKGNLMPWHVKEDLQYYKEKTKDQVVLMGHLTYLSLKSYYKDKPFPYRKIYVANKDHFEYEDAIIINDVVTFLKETREDVFVVGGRMIYELSLPYADYLYISFIKGTHEGDVYFPEFDINKYSLIKEEKTSRVNFTVYKRK
ncbi:dihydrofolate reductase [Acholeplasma sp. OttesenSCG-928-E16]|nr:dihydrofolate reductase [Acholeplasma sp. OttesenSCG-928-E16]